MKIKCLIVVILIIGLICAGCSNENTTPITGSTESSTTKPVDPTNPTDIIPTDPSVYIDGCGNEIIRDIAQIWEKDYIDPTVSLITLTTEWNDQIVLADSIIQSDIAVDVSVVPNYFYPNNTDYVDLERGYYVSWYELTTTTKSVEISRFAVFQFSVVCTTLESGNERHPIIERIAMTTMVNAYEGGLDDLREAANGNLGIGGEYKSIIAILGEPEVSYTDSMDYGLNITTCVYATETTEMILRFTWFEDDGIDTAVLTSIDWIPTTIRDMLHLQDNIELFNDYFKPIV